MSKHVRLFAFLVAGLSWPAFAAGPATAPVSITASGDTTMPYQNEAVRYTVRCVIRAGLSNVTMTDPAVENAIVTRLGDPQVHVAVVNGAPAKVVDFHYVITPMQAGKMVIPAFVLQGNIEAESLEAANDPFGGNFMAGVRQAMRALSNMSSGVPFRVASNESRLEVKAPATPMDPWLPLKSLKIEEDTALQEPQVGEPMIRKITLSAIGAVGSQLPDTEAQEDHDAFRVYADRPAIKTDTDKDSGAISSQRIENYSMVPQRAGRLVLPAIRVSWWDTVNNRPATAVLPARTIKVQPGAHAPNTVIPVVDATGGTIWKDRSFAAYWARKLLAGTMSLLPYGALVVLASLGLVGAVRLWRTGRRRRHRAFSPDRKNPLRGSAGLDALKQVRTAEDLKAFLQAYAQQQLGIPANTPLESMFPRLALSPKLDEDAQILVRALTGALYAGRTADIEDLKLRTWRLLTGLKRQTVSRRPGGDKLPGLNPS
ncbi:MAG: hypothetical protein JWP16_2292 [Alphaproteobacteria bacterium]|nr:hypothetical protein [Alphaproteobacteria bacterium]